MDARQEAHAIALAKAGHRNAFEQLVQHYQNPLFRVVGNLVPAMMVEDLVQDIFLAAYAAIQTYDSRRGSFRTWLYRIARNRAINAARKKREVCMPENVAMVDKRTPATALLEKEIMACLDQALDSLSLQDRFIFVLAELEGLTYADIARIENLPLGTVKSRLARTRSKLRTLLQGYVN